MSKYFIGISISELQHWFADNELPLLTDRVTYYKNCPDDSIPSDFDPGSIFNSLPAFSLDDPAGVLIVEISGPRTWEADDDPNIRYLTMSGVKQFIPLTEDARVALSIQWSDVIKLSEAIFEHEFTRFRINKKSISACKAGNLFANIFIDHKQSKFAASRLFTDSLPRALMAAEHKKQDEIGKTFDRQVETWVERAFGDIRKYDKGNKLLDIKDKADSLKSIAVVGLMLRNVEVEAVRVLTERLGKRWKILETKANDDTKSLAPVYSDEIFSRLDINFNINQNGNESINLVTLALFLRWKMAFHNQRSKVDMLSILDDVKSLTGIVDVKLVSNALWMMGAYLGMENIAHTHHHLNKEKYPTLKFAHSVESLVPVQSWQLTENKYLTEDDFPADRRSVTSEHNQQDQQDQQDQQVYQTDNTTSESLEQTKETESALSVTEIGIPMDTDTAIACSNQGIVDMQQRDLDLSPDAGFDSSELGQGVPENKVARKVAKRESSPPMYRYKLKNGNERTWDGEGSIPKALEKQLEQGRKIEEFLINVEGAG